MASSMTLTASFFGGAVATKQATVTTRRSSQLAVRASMDLEKAVAESSNTRRGLVLSGVGAAAASSVAKVALGISVGFSPVNPCTPEILEIVKFAVSEYNKKNKAALAVEYVISAEKATDTSPIAIDSFKLGIATKDTRTGTIGNYVAVVARVLLPPKTELVSFEPLRK
ncbi:hypothetical protein SASPL_136938 [Salvia splendens]|uniref:Cystatin domain-containing protein n=1 Tax=Salvia splendens TaxID=180675 RepID=A0A8X8WZ56_SALSN|nr:cysteine proteinase inhibitor 5-like [Salvia splendens]KAG6404685.1 hypothetical protein SASPL_136938 [Salvia splendens]